MNNIYIYTYIYICDVWIKIRDINGTYPKPRRLQREATLSAYSTAYGRNRLYARNAAISSEVNRVLEVRNMEISRRIDVNGDFPIKNGDFPIKNDDFPIKNCDFPIKNGDFP